MKQTKLFCHKVDNKYMDFYPGILQVKMCGDEEVIKVIVREALESEIPTHYGWWDNKDQEFCFIYSNLLGVKICFPYGYEVEVKKRKR